MESISLKEQKTIKEEPFRSDSIDKNGDIESSANVRFLTPKQSTVRQRQPSSSSSWKKRSVPAILFLLLIILSVALISTIIAVRKAQRQHLSLTYMNCRNERKLAPDALESLSITGTFQNCSNDTSGMIKKMRMFSTASGDGRKLAEQILPADSNIPAHIILSPLLQVPSNSCWLSLLQTNSSIDKFYIITQLENGITSASMWSTHSFSKVNISDNTQLYISALTAHGSLGTVKITFTPCVEYIRVQKTPIKKGDPKVLSADFTRVRHHQFHRCNYVQFDDRENCDWWEITARNNNGVATGKYEWYREKELESEDLGYKPRENVLKMSGNEEKRKNISHGFLVSPIFTPAEVSRNFTFSFHYKNPCKYNNLSAYVVPENEDFLAATSLLQPFLNITDKTCSWTGASEMIIIPNDYSKFQIILKTSVLDHPPPTENARYCSTSDCLQTEIYMDEITLEINYPKCSSPNNGINQLVSINFTNSNTSLWSYESWKITKPTEVIDQLDYDGIDSRNFTAYSDNYTLWLDLAITGGSDEAYVRSPLLKANSNCSCNFTFKHMYIDPSEDTTYFHVLQRFGENSSQREDDAKSIWFLPAKGVGWKSARVSLMLVNDGIPFQLEFNEERGAHSGVLMFYDDIAFHGCDFSLYEDT